AWSSLHDAELSQLAYQPLEQPPAEIGMCDFPPPECHGRFDLVPLLEKPHGVIPLEAIVMLVGVGAELHLFQLHDVLLPLGFVLALFLLVGILAVVDDLRDRRIGGGRNQYQVQLQVLGAAHSYRRGQNLHLPVREHYPYLPGPNKLVNIITPGSGLVSELSWLYINLLLSGTGFRGASRNPVAARRPRPPLLANPWGLV